MEFYYLFLYVLFLILLLHSAAAAPVGICYGRVANNLPQPSAAASLLQSNGIPTARLFNPEPEALQSFSGTGILLTIGVPNEALPTLFTANSALRWLQSNIFAHVASNQVRNLVVGNEIFLKDPFYAPHLLPAMLSLHRALQILNLADLIKLSSAHAANILSDSYPPSAGAFDPNLKPVMVPLLQFLQNTGSKLMVNVYPFFSYSSNPQYVALDFALFRSAKIEIDQGLAYDNLFDATVDAFVSAMEREGFGGIPVVVAETGWPTCGGGAASAENALAYNGNVVRRAVGNVGTPKRPGIGVEVYLFDMFDENEKDGEEYERHFGIFGVDGVKAYDLNFNQLN